MKNRLSKRTLALLTAAGLLLAGGTVTGVRAYPNIQSDLYVAHFYLNHLQVHLLENGTDVCGGVNTLDGSQKVTGPLATELGYKDDDNLGSVEPGMVYPERIQAQNGQNISQFVRLTVRKYWVETDENGKVATTTDAAGNTVPKKTTKLSPSLIHLMYGGSDSYNTSAWVEDTSAATTESSTYYYRSLLQGDAITDALFDQLLIDKKVAEREPDPVVTKEGNKTIYTYVYKYDGCAFFIEADVQAIQAHNAQQAIESQWGQNIVATYTETENGESGSLSVR